MELGEKIKSARLAAGLSQRQLCGGAITRNMLSQIENGRANPSMDTLRLLAQALNRPLCDFVEDASSPNMDTMRRARQAYAAGSPETALEILSQYRAPDEALDAEKGLLTRLCCLALAEQAIEADRLPYARTLLAQAQAQQTVYPANALEMAVLLSRAGEENELPSLDETLYVYAQDALRRGQPGQASAYLNAMQSRTAQWRLAMGNALYGQKDYQNAKEQLVLAGEPAEALPMLEVCCRETGDFQGAYNYACRRRTAGV